MILDHRTDRTEPLMPEDPDIDPRTLSPAEREQWHHCQDAIEQELLDRHIRALRPYITAA